VPNATGTTAVDLKERHTPRPSRSVNDRVLTFWLDRWVSRTPQIMWRRRSSPRSDTSHSDDKRGGGMWPQYGVRGPLNAD